MYITSKWLNDNRTDFYVVHQEAMERLLENTENGLRRKDGHTQENMVLPMKIVHV